MCAALHPALEWLRQGPLHQRPAAQSFLPGRSSRRRSGALLPSLPVLAEDAIKAALADYKLKQESKKGDAEK